MKPTGEPACLIRIVDDEPRALEAVAFMLECEGYETACFSSAQEFLTSDVPSIPGCVLSDIRMPGMTGLDLFDELRSRNYPHPVLFMTAFADVETAVEAMKNGLVDYLVKPVVPEKLFSSVTRALTIDRQRHAGLDNNAAVWRDHWETLTAREQEVVHWVGRGYLSRQIAIELDISQRTVEAHRASALRKLGVTTPDQVALILSELDET